MISEEHGKNVETLFQSVYGHSESVNERARGMHITYCFCDFLFYGYPCLTKENVMFQCRRKYGMQLPGKGLLGNL